MQRTKPAASPDAYVAALDGWRRKCVEALRATVRASVALEEVVKWGHLVYLANGPVLLIRAEESRVLFGFWRGQRLRAIEPSLKRGGKYEMATLELRQGMTVDAATVRRLAREAVALNERLGDPTLAAKRPLDSVVGPQRPMASKTAVCPVCGKKHPIAESELFFQRPDVIFEIPKSQREKRCKESDDLCVLWGKGLKRDRHFVRAVLPLPVSGRDRPYRIGVWVETTKKDFSRVLDLWTAENQSQEPPFRGKLANRLPMNENTLGLKVNLQLSGPTQRPAVFVTDPGHSLFEEQSQGITAHRADEYTPR